jgi:hypothetical protein
MYSKTGRAEGGTTTLCFLDWRRELNITVIHCLSGDKVSEWGNRSREPVILHVENRAIKTRGQRPILMKLNSFMRQKH